MEVSALRYSGGIGLHGRSPLLRLQSDERLIALVRRGNLAAFEALVARYQARLLAFCRHLLGSKEDAEDVLQEVMAAAFNAMTADERPINVRPWLYRIARNRCLNHLRRAQAVGVDSMDVHLSDFGASTADKVHRAEEFRLLVSDIHQLPETQRTALVLREMDALSYEQISEAMETTVPSVKSLLVRARLSLAEAAEARMLSCEQVRIELAEVAEGLLAKSSPPVRRHLRSCRRCSAFQSELKRTSKALAALMPLGPLAVLKQLAFAHLGHSAGAGSSGAGAAGTGAAVGTGAAAGGAVFGGGSAIPLGLGALASKAAAGLAAAALVTAGAVDLTHVSRPAAHHPALAQSHAAPAPLAERTPASVPTPVIDAGRGAPYGAHPRRAHHHAIAKPSPAKAVQVKLALAPSKPSQANRKRTHAAKKPAGTTQSESVATVLQPGSTGSGAGGAYDQSGSASNPSAATGTTTLASSTPTLAAAPATSSGSTAGTPTATPTPTTTTSGTPTPDPSTGGVAPTPSGDGGTSGTPTGDGSSWGGGEGAPPPPTSDGQPTR